MKSLFLYYNDNRSDRMENEKIKQNSWLSFFHFITRSVFIFSFIVMGGILFLFFLYFGDLLINSITNTHKKPLFGVYIIASKSMVPSINFQDGIFIKRIQSGYQVGDIITFSSDSYYEGKPITHRIIEKVKDKKKFIYTTKGDNNSTVDPIEVKEKDIYGKVLFRIPKLGYIQEFFSSFSIYLVLIFLILFGFLLHRVFWKRRKEKLT